uniref:Peptidase A2 domain-containing protein n=1 Tax=Trichogramma kaykai TaxID=54128 RepID=A0ABD2X6W4_9HYME
MPRLRARKFKRKCGSSDERDNGSPQSDRVQNRVLVAINSSHSVQPPVMSVANRGIKGGRARFLIDTGSDLNLIKRTSLANHVSINPHVIYHLSGINNEAVATFGRVTLKFFDKPCPLDVVQDDFPIEYDGILGMEFLRTQRAVLSFAANRIFIGNQSFRELPLIEYKTYDLRARTKTLVDLDCDFREGNSYMPRIKAGPSIFAGECLVKTQNHRAPLFITNSTSYDINLTLPPIKRYDFETSARVRLARPTVKPLHGPDTERINSILKELNLDSLNPDERAHVINLVAKFPQQFHLPSNRLSMTKATTHKIVTTDNIPINVKQYRHPPYLRDEIQKQITELITNDIVEESDSPYNSPLWIVPKKAGPDGEKKWRLPLFTTPISQCVDGYEHEIERRVFAINCLEHPNDRSEVSNSRIGHRGLAVVGLEMSHQGKFAGPGGYICHQGEAADGQDSHRGELNPGDGHRGAKDGLDGLVSHRAEPLHADGQEGHLEAFPYLDGLVSHLATPSDGPDIDNVEVSSEGSDTDDDMITDISLLPTGQSLEQQLLDLNYLDLELIKTQQLNVGAITESGLSTGHSLFFLFIRNNHEETPGIDIICEILTNLGAALVELVRNSISIAKSNEHLDDMYWLPIETHLEGLATQMKLNITICTGEVTTLREETSQVSYARHTTPPSLDTRV